MLSIRIGYSPAYVLDLLTDIRSKAQTLTGRGLTYLDLFTSYNQWAAEAEQALRLPLGRADVDTLVTTPRYWSTQAVSPGAYRDPLIAVINYELHDRIRALDEACEVLRRDIAKLGGRPTAMAVLDTNVLLNDSADLGRADWHAILNEDASVALHVWIPILAVDEIDHLSHRRTNTIWRGVETSRRQLCVKALGTLRAMFPRPDQAVPWQAAVPGRGPVVAQLLFESTRSVRAGDTDASIIDAALSVAAYAPSIYLVTYDSAASFRAMNAGLQAVVLDDASPPARRANS